MSDLIGLDFETYSGVDLKQYGLERYIMSKSFRPLLASIVEENHGTASWARSRFDMIANPKDGKEWLGDNIGNKRIVAVNVGFERRVLRTFGLDYPANRFIDAAVVARVAGAAGKLEAAAPQLLNSTKLDVGGHLVKRFCMPGKYQEENGNLFFDQRIIEEDVSLWWDFGGYCDKDAELGLEIVLRYLDRLTPKELDFAAATVDMCDVGWPVDVALAEEMQARYLENLQTVEQEFRETCLEPDLNLNSHQQMTEWCKKRGVRARSFDKDHVARLLKAVEKKLASGKLTPDQQVNYSEVLCLLQTKQELGGSSLKKLQVILDTYAEDWTGVPRLKDQYIHAGAGQTLRTTGRSVQMQNLKRLGPEPEDVEELHDWEITWDNDKLARNLRQLFTSKDPEGQLIVGDLSSVESRGLAWQADAHWKLNAFRDGLDIYKVGAARQFSVDYENVTKEQRQFGKVGELSCGYQAGSGAVQSFAAGMGVELSDDQAAGVVRDWRAANPEIEQYWEKLQELLLETVMGSRRTQYFLPDGFRLELNLEQAPASLHSLAPHAGTLNVSIWHGQKKFMVRLFHGVHMRGGNVGYFKPTERKTGDVWTNHYTDPKTKKLRFYELYGGKLAGILTQSFCRELFMRIMLNVHLYTQQWHNLQLIGQFHDELVLDWQPTPGGINLETAMRDLETMMSDPGLATTFPMGAEIKHDYRYTK